MMGMKSMSHISLGLGGLSSELFFGSSSFALERAAGVRWESDGMVRRE
jgi:hypothetical protein